MTTETILNLFPILSLAVSFYILYLYFSQEQDNQLVQENQKLIEKQLVKKNTEIKVLNNELKKQEDMFRSIKSKLEDKNKRLDKKVDELYERWIIIADDRITSIPQTNKDWWDAREIIAQKKQKEWKSRNLSQSKDSFVNENAKYNNYEENEEEVNQDFSEFSDEDFENIIDEDKEDSSSSSATDNTQNRKPKPKKKSNQMKM